MYCDGPLFQSRVRNSKQPRFLQGRAFSKRDLKSQLLLAGRQPLSRLHPLQQRSFGVTNGPTYPEVRGPVTAHASLGEPRKADFEKFGRFLGREQNESRRGRPLRQAASERGLRHRSSFLWQQGRRGRHRPDLRASLAYGTTSTIGPAT